MGLDSLARSDLSAAIHPFLLKLFSELISIAVTIPCVALWQTVALTILTLGPFEAWCEIFVLPLEFVVLPVRALELTFVLFVRVLGVTGRLSLRAGYLIFTESVVDGSQEYSLPSSRAFGVDDDQCAICLDSLHPAEPQLRPVHTALARMRPQFRTAASTPCRRLKLIRLVPCGHAFHADCLEAIAASCGHLQEACPTCRAACAAVVWRRRRITLADLQSFARHALDEDMLVNMVFASRIMYKVLQLYMASWELLAPILGPAELRAALACVVWLTGLAMLLRWFGLGLL